MARHDLPPSDAEFDDVDTAPSIDDLIRPGLRRAFPMCAKGDADDRFRRLLEALSQQHR